MECYGWSGLSQLFNSLSGDCHARLPRASPAHYSAQPICIPMCVCIYIYIYVYINRYHTYLPIDRYRHREINIDIDTDIDVDMDK